MAKFQTLVDIYHDAIKTFPDSPLFGTKKGGQWQWMNYLEFGSPRFAGGQAFGFWPCVTSILPPASRSLAFTLSVPAM